MKRIFLLITAAMMTAGIASAQDINSVTEIYNNGAMELNMGNNDAAITYFLTALEMAEASKITFNGIEVPSVVTGYFTDKAIKTVAMPTIPAGTSELVIVQPFGHRTATEWCYLLGEFGVRVNGTKKTIIKLPETIGFASITDQGLPFYGGVVSYHLPFECDKKCKYYTKN